MGISCASKIFTEQIIVILIGLPGQLNMTDDILVFGRSKEEHHRNLMNVLARLEDSGLTLNKRKCEFYKTELTFYSLKFSAKDVSATEDRRKTMMEFPVPVDAKELKSFLCSMLWSSRFSVSVSVRLLPDSRAFMGVDKRCTRMEVVRERTKSV